MFRRKNRPKQWNAGEKPSDLAKIQNTTHGNNSILSQGGFTFHSESISNDTQKYTNSSSYYGSSTSSKTLITSNLTGFDDGNLSYQRDPPDYYRRETPTIIEGNESESVNTQNHLQEQQLPIQHHHHQMSSSHDKYYTIDNVKEHRVSYKSFMQNRPSCQSEEGSVEIYNNTNNMSDPVRLDETKSTETYFSETSSITFQSFVDVLRQHSERGSEATSSLDARDEFSRRRTFDGRRERSKPTVGSMFFNTCSTNNLKNPFNMTRVKRSFQCQSTEAIVGNDLSELHEMVQAIPDSVINNNYVGPLRQGTEVDDNEDKFVFILWPQQDKEERLNIKVGIYLFERNWTACVAKVGRRSIAFSEGVARGDTVRFAVALKDVKKNNIKECDLAERLALQLESFGMRTSYQELQDMILNKTIANWPIALVLTRRSKPSLVFDRLSLGALEGDSKRAASLIRELNIITRNSVLGGHEELIRSEMKIFMPPSTFGKKTDSLISCELGESLSMAHALQGPPQSSGATDPYSKLPSDFYTLRAKVEDALGLVYFQTFKTGCGVSITGGSGLVIARLSNGDWSPPSALGLLCMGAGAQVGCEVNDYVMLIFNQKVMSGIKRGESFIFNNAALVLAGSGQEYCGAIASMNEDRDDFDSDDSKDLPAYSIYSKNKGFYFGLSIEGAKLFTRSQSNASYYGRKSSVQSILSGKVPAPKEGREINNALRMIEYPYFMNSRPIIPECLKRYIKTEWTVDVSSQVDPGFSGNTSSLTLRELLRGLKGSPKVSKDRKKELDLFAGKFKRFLMEGCPVMFIPSPDDYSDGISHRELRFLHLISNDADVSRTKLCLFDKCYSGCHLDMSPFKSSSLRRKERLHRPFRDIFDEANVRECSLRLNQIIALTQTLPPGVILSDAKRKPEKERFIHLFGRDNVNCMFLTKTSADADLIICGLKLLLEQADYL